ncbi:MAG: hypothetical protein ABEJ55_08340 [Halanaeroarchaeum sp.]
MPAGTAFLFTCAACGERVRVDRGMRETLLAEGCALCGATVSAGEFDRIERVDPRRN